MQETKNLILPASKTNVSVKAYVTGFIDQQVETIRLGANKTHYEADVDATASDQVAAAPKGTKVIMDVDPTVKLAADNKLIELMVLSVNDKPVAGQAVLDTILALPKSDVNYLIAELKGVEAESKVEGADPKVLTN